MACGRGSIPQLPPINEPTFPGWLFCPLRAFRGEPQATAPTQVHCTHEKHALAILDIFNEAILNSTALYDYKPRASESMGPGSRPRRAFPVIGIEDPDGTLLAFGSYGSFRVWPAYKVRSSIRCT